MQDDCPISKYDNSSFAASVALAAASDYIVLMLGIDGTVEGESMDRTSIDLPQIQHDLAGACCFASRLRLARCQCYHPRACA